MQATDKQTRTILSMKAEIALYSPLGARTLTRLSRKPSALMLVFLLLPISQPSAQAAVERVASRPATQAVLTELGIPLLSGDAELRRSSCITRELIPGLTPGRKALSEMELTTITGNVLHVPAKAVTGINVSIHCQMGYVVADLSPNGETLSERTVTKVFPVSSGKAGLNTHLGTMKVERRWAGWHESSAYPGSHLYKTQYFYGGQAVHGLRSDRMVKTYPASHGCVRVRQRDADWLWEHIKISDKIRIYGTY